MSVTGTVASVTATTITVIIASGATIEIPIDSSTTFHNATAASSADVSAADAVTIQVSRGADGGTGTATDVTVTAP